MTEDCPAGAICTGCGERIMTAREGQVCGCRGASAPRRAGLVDPRREALSALLRTQCGMIQLKGA